MTGRPYSVVDPNQISETCPKCGGDGVSRTFATGFGPAACSCVNRPHLERRGIVLRSQAVTQIDVVVPCPECHAQFEGRVPGHKYGSNWDWVPCQTCNRDNRGSGFVSASVGSVVENVDLQEERRVEDEMGWRAPLQRATFARAAAAHIVPWEKVERASEPTGSEWGWCFHRFKNVPPGEDPTDYWTAILVDPDIFDALEPGRPVVFFEGIEETT